MSRRYRACIYKAAWFEHKEGPVVVSRVAGCKYGLAASGWIPLGHIRLDTLVER
jgi:hypothetical protein